MEFGHIDDNVNRTWSVRIGPSGDIYSYIAAYGEAMPPQYHVDGPFNDEVWQMVAVDNNKTDPSNDNPYFIHQAGIYQNEPVLDENPFFSPTVAKHCAGRECRIASWGRC